MESPAGDDVLANSITHMKNKQLKTYGGKLLLAGLAAVAISLGSAKAGQPDDQVAVQLGAIYLNTPISNSSNATVLANALVQGRAILAATVKTTQAKMDASQVLSGNFSVSIGGNSTVQGSKTDLQSQILAATEAALKSPIDSAAIKATEVTLKNNKKVKVTAVLSPTKTTASAIAAVTLKRTPNFGPEIATLAVQAAMAYSSNATTGVNKAVFGYKGATNAKLQAVQLTDAGKAATLVLSSSLKAYAAGTQNWVAVPKTGTQSGVVYLPNFGTKDLPSGNVNNKQIATPALTVKFASAIAANAINGLGDISVGAAGTYGKNQANVASLTKALVKAAAAFQKISLEPAPGATNGQKTVGTIGGSVLGIIAQVSGVKNGGEVGNTFGTQNASSPNLMYKSVLQGVIDGAIAASPTNAWAVAIGVAQGFAGTYLKTVADDGGTAISADAFIKLNSGEIKTALESANKNKAFTKSQLGNYADITAAIDGGITAIFTAFAGNTFTNISGAAGIRNFGLINGVGSPVTDTVGL